MVARAGLQLLAFALCLVATSAVRDSKYYRYLDVDPSADEATLKKAYRKQAV